MSTFRILFLLFVVPLLALSSVASTRLADGGLSVDEEATQLEFASDGLDLKLAVVNPGSQSLSAGVQLELISPSDDVVKSVSRTFVLKPNVNLLAFRLRDFSHAVKPSLDEFFWFRLKYRLSQEGGNPPAAPVSGVISVSRIVTGTFALQIATPDSVVGGERLNVPVFTPARGSGKPIANVDIEGTLTIADSDDETSDRVQSFRARTGPHGDTMLTFQLPEDLGEDPDITLKVRATRGSEVREVEEDLYTEDREAQVIITTDKPLYQPGQRLNVRMLAFAPSGAPLAQKAFKLELRDPSGSVQFRADLKTSRYGEAHTEWAIPENAMAGAYEIGVEDSDGNISGDTSVGIRPYELPVFAIRTKSDRPYYLPNQTAEVTIETNYVFGQPVPGALVKIAAAAAPRSFNLGAEEPSPAVIIEGVADASGRFTAKIDPWKAAADGQASGSFRWSFPQFQDRTYVAFVTDPVSKRSEERRFDLRATNEPIHVHLTNAHQLGENGPVEMFVSTQYADGTPASCSVEIRLTDSRGDAPVVVVKTDRFGVAKVQELRVPPTGSFVLSANDGKGSRGSQTIDRLAVISQADVEVDTDKVVYAAGDPLNITIRSIYKTGPVILDVFGGQRRIDTQIEHLEGGAASVTVPYSKTFRGALSIVAHYAGDMEDYRNGHIRTVSYPGSSDLVVEVTPEKPTYAPGEEARVAFKVRRAGSGPRGGLLGIVVRDSAVDERAEPGHDRVGAKDTNEIIQDELSRLDRTRSLPPSLSVPAEFVMAQLARQREISVDRSFNVDRFDISPALAFQGLIVKQFAALRKVLPRSFGGAPRSPQSEVELLDLIAETGTGNLVDPWQVPYRMAFTPYGSFGGNVLSISFTSSGPDHRAETPDDFVVFSAVVDTFQAHGAALNRAGNEYRQRAGGYPRDIASLREAVREIGENMDSWRDFWGNPYEFTLRFDRTNAILTVAGQGSKDSTRSSVTVWTASWDYTEALRRNVEPAVNRYRRETGAPPKTQAQFNEALRHAGLPDADRLDPWGHPYDVFFEETRVSRNVMYSSPPGRWVLEIPYAAYTETAAPEAAIGTMDGSKLTIRGRGSDSESSNDDFDIAILLWLKSPTPPGNEPAKTSNPATPTNDGSIRGVVRNPAGMPTGRAGVDYVVTLVDAQGKETGVRTDAAGNYAFTGLAPGLYRLFVGGSPAGRIITDIPVVSGTATTLDLVIDTNINRGLPSLNGGLSFGSLNTVRDGLSEGLPLVGNDPIQLIATLPGFRASGFRGANRFASFGSFREELDEPPVKSKSSPPRYLPGPAVTPRLREYFPETLVWQPALETDRQGNAELKFKLADNITAWKIEATASTLDGRVATTEAEILAFQPFFVEHNPPRILTQGDSIALPVTIRNYLETDQSLDIAMKPESWFATSGPQQQKTSVKAGEAVTATFAFKATATIKDGKQRVTALGTTANDSIEKPLTVHPDGREVSQTESRIVKGSATFDLAVPSGALPGSAKGLITLYPDLAAHIAQAIEGILERPHGCAEQVISSTYPSLLLLRVEKQTKRSGPLTSKASVYLEKGYARLTAYQSKDGGFTYWGSGDSDIALTAYAVQFLAEVKEFIAVDEEVLWRAAGWLASQQRDDGSWRGVAYGAVASDSGNLAVTNTVTQVLSLPGVSNLLGKRSRDTLGDAVKYARNQTDGRTDPYTLALSALTALHRSDRDTATSTLRRIEELAQTEGDTSYWDLEGNSPFFGWGLPGRVESSALNVRALVEGAAAGIRTEKTQTLIDRGLLFLLRNKDRYGVWHSTQATSRVLDTLSRMIGTISGKPQTANSGQIDIRIGGKNVRTIQLARGGAATNPITVDISEFLRVGANSIEVSTGGTAATVQIAESHYVPWAGATGAPQFNVRFDKTQGRSGDTFTASVHAERGRSGGYGMMLAEIGLPPGVDVDLESLEQALRGGNLSRYEIQPDRVVAYLWPRFGATEFQFKFRMRYGVDAQTAPSILYDYYNPGEESVVAPTHFVVR